jgi:hypothetical protein
MMWIANENERKLIDLVREENRMREEYVIRRMREEMEMEYLDRVKEIKDIRGLLGLMLDHFGGELEMSAKEWENMRRNRHICISEMADRRLKIYMVEED